MSRIDTLMDRLAGARVLILFLFHALVFCLAYVFAYLVRFEFEIPASQMDPFEASLPVVVGVQLVAGFFFQFYRGWWRYVGISDVVRLVAGLTTAQICLLAIWFVGPELDITSRLRGVSRGALLIDWAFALLILFGVRVAIRLFRDRTRRENTPHSARKTLIIGAGDAGEALAREIQHRPQMGMKIVGFLDDKQAKWNSDIRGIPVLGPIRNVQEYAEEYGVTDALIAIPTASGKRIREIVRLLDEAALEFKTMPGVDQLVSGKVHVAQLRPVNLEDLIRREEIELPGDPVRKLFAGRRILITGAGGTIGSELASQILELEPAHLALVERSEYGIYEVDKRLRREREWLIGSVSRHLVDVRDDKSVRVTFERVKPEIVLHAAAHKHVPLGEENPVEYIRNNTMASLRLAEICEAYGVERFVLISTDKAINPTSVMGASKRAAEILLLDFARESTLRTTIVRFGNVLGSSGSVVPLFLEQIAAGGPVTVTHPEVTRYFLRQSEAISLVLQAASLGEDQNILMLDMGEPIRIADLARDVIRLSSHDDGIEIRYTGLRPGEKLFEEIRMDGETSIPTEHPQIVITKAPQPDREQVRRMRERLERVSYGGVEDPRQALCELIPEFVAPSGKERGGVEAALPGGRVLAEAGHR
jgi:FlaA1/EpsC-like NDP-sugar epimerase